jgi:formylglycine-generating enzyme
MAILPKRFVLVAGILCAAGLAIAGHAADNTPRTQPVPGHAITNAIGMRVVRIEPGTFMMGSPESGATLAKAFAAYGATPEEFEDEHPLHRVQITRPFYLGVYEVTVGQFRKFVADSGYRTEPEKDGQGGSGYNAATGQLEGRRPQYTWRHPGFPQTDEHPVVNVTWNDAITFCEWLSRKEGKTYRLPTEAEWEYACRAGTRTRWYCGDEPKQLAEVANVADATFQAKFPGATAIRVSDGHLFTAPVGRFRPNGFGLHDMHGNVWEWCADWYAPEYYATSRVTDPAGSDSGTSRVLRGGSWNHGPGESRSAVRTGIFPRGRGNVMGFRVARNP